MGTQNINTLLEAYKQFFLRIVNPPSALKEYPGHETLEADYMAITTAAEADQFFEKYGVGNTIGQIHSPLERGLAYELLLTILKEIDEPQYFRIHKGTPYYFIGWTTYQTLNYRKAVFYMDAAVSEDLQFPDVQQQRATRPSLQLFLLEGTPGPSGLPVHVTLQEVVTKTLLEYQQSGGGTIQLDDFRHHFIRDLLFQGPSGRSLLTALFTFLLEFEEREKEISVRSASGGSIQPFLDHLFDGARLLESLLEYKGSQGDTLGVKIRSLPVLGISKAVLLSKQKLQDAEITYQQQKAAGASFQDQNFAAAYIIRNTTGHSLLWPDQFASQQSYQLLYQSLVNAILWTVQKLWSI